MNEKFPNLHQMGVQNPDQIISYTISHVAPDTDVLRIKYQRPKGSFLPLIRSYHIGRTPHTHVVDSGSGEFKEFYDISPVLSNAILELDSIVNTKATYAELKQQILSELDRIQAEVTAELNAVRLLVNKLDCASGS